jgi:ABC-type Fe3+-siderophore transport system permease subunit
MIPKVGTSTIKEMFKSPEIIAVGSAAVLAPLLSNSVYGFLAKIPFLKDHKTIATFVFAVIAFAIAVRFKGVMRAILIGVAGSFFITAIVPLVSSYIHR